MLDTSKVLSITVSKKIERLSHTVDTIIYINIYTLSHMPNILTILSGSPTAVKTLKFHSLL
jgi:hypothetical protein